MSRKAILQCEIGSLENGTAMADWSSLPHELVSSISDRLSTVEDFSAFAAVCRSFRLSAIKEHRRRDKVSQQPPWLLLSCRDNIDGDENNPPTNERGLLSIYRNNRRFSMNLPELHGRHCWGTPHGWIVTLGLDLQLHLFNPLNRRRIPLPEINCSENPIFVNDNDKAQWMRYLFIRRALLIKRSNSYSSGGLFDDFFVVVATTPYGRLSVMRPETNTWVFMNEIHLGGTEKSTGFVFDAVNYNGEIYALCNRGRLLVCSNMDGPDQPTSVEVVPDDERLEGDEKLYLVESDGDLLMLARRINYDLSLVLEYLSCESSGVERWYATVGFGVFKLNQEDKEWIEIDDLGDRALFVGDCQSVSLSSSSEAFGCRSNCIYFTDDNYEHFKGTRGHDMGVFHLEHKTIKPFYEGSDTLSSYSTPNWFLPTFI